MPKSDYFDALVHMVEAIYNPVRTNYNFSDQRILKFWDDAP